jgi:hypothetical protein
MTGTYDFTTVLDTFVLVEPLGAPGCQSGTGYCATTIPASGAELGGTFIVGDSVSYHEGLRATAYQQVSATILGIFRASRIQDIYRNGLLTGPLLMADAVDGSKVVVGLQNEHTDAITLAGSISGDSITGSVSWAMNIQQGHASRYYGHFVARRR